jgi:peptide/nickel transport system ATP-binding protein
MPSSTSSTHGSIRGCAVPDAAAAAPTQPLLEVRDLSVSFRTEHGVVRAVDGLSLTLALGEVLGIVGESGSGKTVSMMAVMRLIRDPNAVVTGRVLFRGRDLLKLSQREMRQVRGGEISMIFQDPLTALTPVYTIGWQIAEQLRAHAVITKRQARRRAIELLAEVGISSPDRRVDDYPHQFSGGMRQRVMIAMALSCNPSLLIADEPTTALDVTIQAQIMEELGVLRRETGAGILLITHDLGVVADIADRIIVMYAGQIIEQGTLDELFYDPQHPYTWGLLGSITRVDRVRTARLPAIPGQPPSLLNAPKGCHFRPRCPHAFAACTQPPALEVRLPERTDHRDRCFLTPDRPFDRRDCDRVSRPAPRSSAGVVAAS